MSFKSFHQLAFRTAAGSQHLSQRVRWPWRGSGIYLDHHSLSLSNFPFRGGHLPRWAACIRLIWALENWASWHSAVPAAAPRRKS